MAEKDIASEIAEEYQSSLVDLKNNDKAHINMLSILAKDYAEHAPAIVEVIEKRVIEVPKDIKLSVMYLIDSIMKNVNKGYITLFAKNIVRLFEHVFHAVDEVTRSNMFKLRQTWAEVFPAAILFALDVRINVIDPAWPIVPLPTNSSSSSSIHVNPKFLGCKKDGVKKLEKNRKTIKMPYVPTTSSTLQKQSRTSQVAPAVPDADLTEEQNEELHRQVLEKQKELVELQKRKVQLELKQVKKNLAQHKRKVLDLQSLDLPPTVQVALNEEELLESQIAAMINSSQYLKPIEKQFPAAAASLSLKKSESNKAGVRIAPASSIAIAAAKPIASRDPRLKQQVAATAIIDKVNVAPIIGSQTSNTEITQKKLMEQFKLHMQSRKRPLSTDTIKQSIVTEGKNKSLQNKKIRTTNSDKSDVATIGTPTLNTTRNHSIKDQSKSSSSTKSSSRTSSSSKSSSSSRKSDSKARSKSSSSSSTNKKSDENSSSPSTSSSTSSSPEKRSSSKKSKSQKPHSPSPPLILNNNDVTSYRIPRRSKELVQNTVTITKPTITNLGEQDVFGATALPTTSFKEIKSKQRNYVRRNKDGSPDNIEGVKTEAKTLPDSSKDEDLRSLNVTAAGAVATLKTKDLDLRVLTVPSTKRASTTDLQATAKKSKTENVDPLFGNKDVDLRTLTNPKAGRPPTPPPPVISNETQKPVGNCWAKIKSPVKQERSETPAKPLADRNRGRLNSRPRFNSTEASKNVKEPRNRCQASPPGPNNEQNIEIIMKQAAEQLNQGLITKAQYNKLIQEVLHMSEDQKLKAAQRQELESGIIWEKTETKGFSNDENLRKDHPMHSRIPPAQGAPRWQGPWHWPHPPPPPGPFPPGPFPDGFRPMGPWQNHPRMYGPPIRPEFHPGPMHPGFNPRMGMMPPHMGPNGPRGMMKGPMMGPGPMPGHMGNGPIRPDRKRLSPNSTAPAATASSASATSTPATTVKVKTEEVCNGQQSGNQGELPPADPQLIEEVKKDTMKSINIDGVPREIRYYGNCGIVFMRWDDPRDIGFQDGSRRIFIEGMEPLVCKFNDDYKEFMFEGEMHRIKLGTPTRELYVNDKWYECYFGGRPVPIELNNKKVNVSLEGPPPQVKIGTVQRTDLVAGKINFIINARTMVPVFVDSKPQIFEIEGTICTLEFTDALQTVLLNGRPYSVDFGGMPKPVIINGKKHFLRFTVLPRGVRPGYVKILGMKGEPPKIDTQPAITVPKTEPLSNNVTFPSTSLNALPGLEDTSSQDSTEASLTSKPDLQIDVLSSVLPSAMAPASGLSYQAEPVENTPTPAPILPSNLNLNELFQRLVETGIVPSLATREVKTPEEEEKRPVEEEISFDKPETLKTKRPSVATALYSGMQCSSCGVRFAPELASRYSQHLDWHFRQNRKERESSRKAHSRTWYYDISDWTQFEEIEDLETRTQSYFETEKTDSENGSVGSNCDETEQPSVPTGSDEDGICEVCHETFEQFFNEEKEEWHLRPTITFEGKNFHPVCLEDYKKALEKSAMALEEVIAEMEEETNKTGNEDPKADIESSENMEVETENTVEVKVKVEKEDVQEIEIKTEKEEETDVNMDDSEPIEIIEPLPRQIEIAEIDDSSDDENEIKIPKIKIEPKKEDEKIPDDVPLIFENVKVKEEPLDSETETESIPAEPTNVDTTKVAVKSTIDGNVELDSARSTIPTVPSKIKINITKTLNVTSKDSNSEKEKLKKKVEGPTESPAAKPLIPAAIKPALQGKKLSILPTIEKGHELSGLCSIM